MPRRGSFRDLTGVKFGKLTAVRHMENRAQRGAMWEVHCDCGSTKIMPAGRLLSGASESCGCSKGHHGMSGSKTYASWGQMIQRCTNPKTFSYPKYGARGIAVCQRWMNFENFLADMGERPPGKTIDRINNNGNYEPGNCRWATRTEQARNTSRNNFVVVNDAKVLVTDLATRNGIRASTARARICLGWEFLRAATAPVQRQSPTLAHASSFLVEETSSST